MTVTATGVPPATQNILGLVSETGQFHFISDDGAQYFGTLTISGRNATSKFVGVPSPGATFVDGSVSGTGTLNGTIQERATLTATAVFTTANNAVSNVSMTVQYDRSYEVNSSLAAVDGNYTAKGSPPGTDTITISNGQFSYADNTGCLANGTVSIIDARYNLYNVEFTFANCSTPGQNGLQLQGLLTIYATSNPNLLVFAVHGTVQGTPVAASFGYERT
jgi:hypothetical protein